MLKIAEYNTITGGKIDLKELGKRTENLLDHKFGKLIVIDFVGVDKTKKAMWLCKCECGNTTITNTHNLKSGNTTSCGCSRTKLKQNIPRLYRIWNGMKTRCSNPNKKEYKNYGGRGIKVCDEWLKYENFYNWAINNGYKDNLTIERINNDSDYEPSNCTWITIQEQQKNKRKPKIREVNKLKKEGD